MSDVSLSETTERGPSREHDGGASFSKWGILSDIHGNLPALTACLDDMEVQGCDRLYCCGDLVGYGAQPNECCAVIRERAIPTIMGNHDFMATNLVNVESFNEIARKALLWTHDQLTPANMNYLLFLPFVRNEDDFTFVHASPLDPEKWNYILTRGEARINFECFDSWICFLGHSHQPFVVEQVRPRRVPAPVSEKGHDDETDPPWMPSPEDRVRLKTGAPIPKPAGIDADRDTTAIDYNSDPQLLVPDPTVIELNRDNRYLVNVGSVGQPRDRNPRACYVTVDLRKMRLDFHRVDYPIAHAQKAILEANLPPELAQRLSLGR